MQTRVEKLIHGLAGDQNIRRLILFGISLEFRCSSSSGIDLYIEKYDPEKKLASLPDIDCELDIITNLRPGNKLYQGIQENWFMKEYFTISEFAKLRNININSLRYYEKIGVLHPAKTDISTKYRYYSAEQLLMLDLILWCTEIGIPLKELKDYQDQGCILSRKLFEASRKIALQKMRDIQSGLEKIEYVLNCQDSNREYENRHGFYERTFPERHIITRKWSDHPENLQEMKDINTSLFLDAEKNHMNPIPPFGVIMQFRENSLANSYIYCEVLKNFVGKDKDIFTVPADSFLCKQAETSGWASREQLAALVQNEITGISDNELTVIISGMILDNYTFERNTIEMEIIRKFLI